MIKIGYRTESLKFVATASNIDDRRLLKKAGWLLPKPEDPECMWEATSSIFAARVASTDEQNRLVEKVKHYVEHPSIRASYAEAPSTDEGEQLVGYNGLLLPFQAAGIEQIRARGHRGHGVLLADDMGLGKTMQSIIAELKMSYRERRVLIVSTATARQNWANEWASWGGEGETGIATSKEFPSTRAVIINYDILTRHHKAIHAEEWGCVILDEVHRLKTPTAQRTMVIFGDTRSPKAKPPIKADYKIGLSGTPILNRPAEAWGLLHWLDPETFPWKTAYMERYCKGYDGFGPNYRGSSNMEELQYLMRQRVMVRRQKSKVLTQLPDKVRQIIPLDVEGVTLNTNAKLRAAVERSGEMNDADFAGVERYLRNELGIGFEEISALRKAEADAKLPYVIKAIEEEAEDAPEEPIIIMCHHNSVALALREHFGRHGVSFITGSVAKHKRDKEVSDFQNGKNRFFVGNIEAAGESITLTRAALMCFAEISWVPGKLWQAEDRFHRIGQTRGTLVKYYVTSGGIDEYMLRTVLRKQSVIDAGINSLTKKR